MSVQAWYRQACAYEQLKQHAAAEVSARRAMDTARYTMPCYTLQVQHACCLILAVGCAQSRIVEVCQKMQQGMLFVLTIAQCCTSRQA